MRTLVRLQVLNAFEAAATACSNSELVVSGTRVSRVCEAWFKCDSSDRGYESQETYWIKYIDPVLGFTLREMTTDEVLGIVPHCAGTFPFGRELLSLLASYGAQPAQRSCCCESASANGVDRHGCGEDE